tara:strand:- start:53 stop:1999 length:1947 start_codon:yes stop_codon:yes gene_type:complete
MAVNTWDGSSSTDWGTAANWTTTGVTDRVPTADDDVVIPDCSSINNCILDGDTTINSLALATSSNFSMNNHDLTIDGENGSGRAIDVGSNTLTFVGGTGTLIFTLGSGTTKLQGIQHLAASTELRNVQFNGGATFQLEGDTTITGNLTISAGTLTTLDSDGSTSRNLTVTGDCIVEGTLTGNASAISLGSLRVDGTYSATSGTTIITSERSNGRAIDIVGTYTHNSGTLEIQTPADTDLRYPSSSSLNDLTINHASCIARPTGDNKPPIGGDLTITAGTFNTLDSGGGSSHDLTVTGDVSVTGTLTGNASAISLGSLTIESGGTYSATSGTTTITKTSATAGHSGQPSAIEVKSGGTFTNNDGTVLLSSSLDQDLEFDGTGNMHHLTINKSDNDVIHSSNLTIEGDLSITLATAHAFRPNTGSRTLTVTGDVTIVEGKVGDVTNYTGNHSFGSLEIQSGGEYIATSGTTTITTGGTIGGTTNTAFGGEGTFTHNNGTLVLDSVLHRIPKGGTFYNLKLTGSQNTGGIYLYSDTMLPQGIMPDGTTGSAYFSVLGTLEITDDEFRPYNADKVYIHNLVIGDGTGSANSAKFDFAEVDEFDGKVFVDNVTIHSDGQLLFGDGNETSATEGSSALNIYGAFRNLGGNVTIE